MIPPRYQDLASSGLRITVAAGENPPFDFELAMTAGLDEGMLTFFEGRLPGHQQRGFTLVMERGGVFLPRH